MLRTAARVADDASMRTASPLVRCALFVLAGTLAVGGLGLPASAADPEQYPVPESGVFHMKGSGWGHGRGMSQWGAFQAATEGRTHAEILDFYYPGTSLKEVDAGSVRVLLGADTGRDLRVRAVPGLVARYTDASGARAVKLPARPGTCATNATRWRAMATTTGVRLSAYCGAWRTVVAGAKVLGGRISFEVPGGIVATVNGTSRRGYRGRVAAVRTGSRSVLVVNTLPMDTYLRPVVAAEVSPSWPVEALRAQAVAARSYAAHEALGRSGRSYDVYDSTRSQAYPGAVIYDSAWRVASTREHPRTDAAITDTASVQVVAAGAPALTQFGSSNGGATADSPLSYMTAAADPWDARATRNPRLSWTDSISAASLAARYPGAGTIRAIRIVKREGAGPWGGRIASLQVVGSTRSYTVTGDSAIRSVLGVYSSFLTFTD